MIQQSFRCSQVFHDVQQKDVIEFAGVYRKFSPVKIALNKVFETDISLQRKLINTSDTAMLCLERLRHITARATYVGNIRAGANTVQLPGPVPDRTARSSCCPSCP